MQDKDGRESARWSLTQPARKGQAVRAAQEQPSTSGTHSSSKPSRRVKITLWVERPIAAELERLAQERHLSISATGAALLAQLLEQSLETRYSALLEPMVRQAVRGEMRTLGNRLAALLVGTTFTASQTRQLVINVLARLENRLLMPEEVLSKIKDGSGAAAKAELRRRPIQLSTLVEDELENWLRSSPEDSP